MYSSTVISYGYTPSPEAFITRGKNRLRQNGSEVYLKNNDEFEIELFNPKTVTVLAKININGTAISQRGLVLKPGERVFLDRYIDVAKKFLFTTYEVDGTNSAVQQAIMNNGLVEIFFYDESQPVYTAPINNTPFIYYGDNFNTPQPSWYAGTTYTANNTVNYFHSNSMSLDSLETLSFCNTTTDHGTLRSKGKVSKSMETGRVEQGSKSKTELKSVNIDFSPIYSTSVTWKIVPESQQPVQASDLRSYCTGCGTRIKKSSWVFCPSCGNKL